MGKFNLFRKRCICSNFVDYDIFICPYCLSLIEENIPNDGRIRDKIDSAKLNFSAKRDRFDKFYMINAYLIMFLFSLTDDCNELFIQNNAENYYTVHVFHTILAIGFYTFSIIMIFAYIYATVIHWFKPVRKLILYLKQFFIFYIVKYVLLIIFFFRMWIPEFIRPYTYVYLKRMTFTKSNMRKNSLILHKLIGGQGNLQIDHLIFNLCLIIIYILVCEFVKDIYLFVMCRQVKKFNAEIAEEIKKNNL